MDENLLIFNFIKEKGEVMFDVGAAHGHTSTIFLKNGWKSYMFEPNPERYQYIEKFNNINGKLIKRAIDYIDDKELNFFLSKESAGISSLTNFHKTHELANFQVKTKRLDTFIDEESITKIDYLKIDTEGHDLIVLKTFPFDKIKPNYILCEFEDLKTIKLNYKWFDMAEYIKELGYKIIISEWFPILKYGGNHKFNTFKIYPDDLYSENAWGNLMCFKEEEDFNNFILLNKKFFKNDINYNKNI